MPLVFVPVALRALTQGQQVVPAAGDDVAAVLDEMERVYPGFGEHLLDGGQLKSGWAVVVNQAVAPEGLQAKTPQDAEVHFVSAVGGG